MKRRRSSPDQGGPSGAWHGNIASGSARVHNGHHYGDAIYNITYSDTASLDVRQQILNSLWFDMMEARQDSIKGATPDTLDWVYEPQESAAEDHNNPQWDSLRMWLEEGGSIYWVCGKAGSGKSTLMAHIVDDCRTVECLSRWSCGKSLHILKFFFWRPGTELQKSVTGLLRALLYQICTEVEDAIPRVAKASQWDSRRQIFWSDKRLTTAIGSALSSRDHVFCFFLDGLDEFFGDLSTLKELFYQFRAPGNVKFCVSSRPEAELIVNLSSCRQLRLERLNRGDINRFVEDQLNHLRHMPSFRTSELQNCLGLVDEVVYRADGVFLWAVLVIPTLVRGIISGDDWNTLLSRLDKTPTAIDDLYASMLTNLDPLHRDSFHFYLELLKVFGGDDHDDLGALSKVTVAQITAAQLGEDLLRMSYNDFLQTCDQERLRINSRSVGLLQISERRRGDNPNEGIAILQLDAHNGMPSTRIGSARDAVKLRTAVICSKKAAKAHVRANDDVVDWMHRSAHDFIFPPDGSASFPCSSQSRRLDVYIKFLLGGLNLLAVSPSFGRTTTTSGYRLSDLIKMTDRIIDNEVAFVTASKIAKDIRLVVCDMHHEDFDWSELPYPNSLDRSLNAFPFWARCFTTNAWSVVRALMPLLLSEPAGNALLMPLWNTLLCSFFTPHELPSWAVERVFMPLLKKIEDNIWLQGGASARDVLYSYDAEDYKYRDYPRVRHLLCRVPDFLGPRQPAAVQMFFQAFLQQLPHIPEAVVAGIRRVAESISLLSEVEIE